MSKRDRMLLMAVGAIVVLGGFWLLVISPKRDEASKLDKQISDKQAEVDKQKAQLQPAAQHYNYNATYATLAKLGKSAPPVDSVDDDVPALILQLGHIGQSTTTVGGLELADQPAAGAAPAPAPAPAPGAPATPPSTTGGAATTAATPTPAGAAGGTSAVAAQTTLTPLGAKITYGGKFYDLEDVLHFLNGMTDIAGKKKLTVKGRLVTIRAIKMELPEGKPSDTTAAVDPQSATGQPSEAQLKANEASAKRALVNPEVKAEIFVNLYTLPAETSLFGTGTDVGGAPPPNVPATPGDSGNATTSVPPKAVVTRP